MILVIGDRSDDAVESVTDALRRRRAEVRVLDRSALSTLAYDVRFGSAPSGMIGGIDVAAIRGMYVRPTPSTDARAAAATETLMLLASTVPCTVVNRPTAGRSNGSKPYHRTQLRSLGLDVPPTLVTSSPEDARAFLGVHGRVIYKSISGTRSIVTTLEGSEHDRLRAITGCPVQFQAYVPGLDVRVHVIGTKWFACAARSEATDYRYAVRTGHAPPELFAYEIPDTLGTALVAANRALGLVFSGVDLRVTPEGRYVCFEINPSPGFSWYEQETGHPIADTVAEMLTASSRSYRP